MIAPRGLEVVVPTVNSREFGDYVEQERAAKPTLVHSSAPNLRTTCARQRKTRGKDTGPERDTLQTRVTDCRGGVSQATKVGEGRGGEVTSTVFPTQGYVHYIRHVRLEDTFQPLSLSLSLPQHP